MIQMFVFNYKPRISIYWTHDDANLNETLSLGTFELEIGKICNATWFYALYQLSSLFTIPTAFIDLLFLCLRVSS